MHTRLFACAGSRDAICSATYAVVLVARSHLSLHRARCDLRFGLTRRVVNSLRRTGGCVVSVVQHGQPDAADRTCRLFSSASTSATTPCFRHRGFQHAKIVVTTAPYRSESAHRWVVTVISRSQRFLRKERPLYRAPLRGVPVHAVLSPLHLIRLGVLSGKHICQRNEPTPWCRRLAQSVAACGACVAGHAG